MPLGIKDIPSQHSCSGSFKRLEISVMRPKSKIVPEMVTMNLNEKNKPRLNSKIENLIDYQSEFKEGFEKIYHLILGNKTKLLSKDSPLEYFRNLKIRFVYR